MRPTRCTSTSGAKLRIVRNQIDDRAQVEQAISLTAVGPALGLKERFIGAHVGKIVLVAAYSTDCIVVIRCSDDVAVARQLFGQEQ